MVKYTKAEKVEAIKQEDLTEAELGKKPKLANLKPISRPR